MAVQAVQTPVGNPVRSPVGNPVREPMELVRVQCGGETAHQEELQLFSALRALFAAEAAGRSIRVVCVGTPLNAGDSVGPMAGTLLSRSVALCSQRLPGLSVVGTLADPVHAKNLHERVDTFHAPDTFTLAVDAATGRPGGIVLRRGPLLPGVGVGRTLPPVGQAHLLCGISPLPLGFWSAHMGLVLEMAELVSRSVLRAALSARGLAS